MRSKARVSWWGVGQRVRDNAEPSYKAQGMAGRGCLYLQEKWSQSEQKIVQKLFLTGCREPQIRMLKNTAGSICQD